MVIVRSHPLLSSYVVHEAPVNEKTLELRKKFDVDEETGYPRHYNFRPMARLGPEYDPRDPFFKLTPDHPNQHITERITSVGLVFLVTAGIHVYRAFRVGRPIWVKPHEMLIPFALVSYSFDYLQSKGGQKIARMNAITTDYISKHPDRFERIKRPKVREILFEYTAPR